MKQLLSNKLSLQTILDIINCFPNIKNYVLQNKTVIPSSLDQIIIPDEEYNGLAEVVVKGDENLKSENIKNDTSIFNIIGTYTGDNFQENSLITRTITDYSNDTIKNIGNYTFEYCYSLISVSFPVCTDIGSYAFYHCSSLQSVNFPVCTYIDNNAFQYCTSLSSVNFPACTSIGGYAFAYCSSLSSVNFPACTSIMGSYVFRNCYILTSLYLTGSSLCTLSNSNTFASTPISGYSALAGCYGSIYVPQSLLTSYQTATNWAYFSSRFVAYDEGSSGSGNIITFTIEEISYQAEEGMTWAEWCDSEYNTGGYYLSNKGYVYNGENYVWEKSDGNLEASTAETGDKNIISTQKYVLKSISSVW